MGTFTLTLSESELREVYYALDSKAKEIEEGRYGASDPEVNTEEWAGQLRGIIARIEGIPGAIL